MKTRLLAGLLGVGLSMASVPAAANGRFPSAQLLVIDPSDPNRLWVRGTHGVLTSADGGCTWHMICEAAIGYRGTEDPMVGVMADGTVIAGIFEGMATSRTRGCDWSLAGPMDGLNVVDLSVQKDDPARAIAISSNGDGTGGFVNRVWRTTDSATTWSQLGPQVQKEILPFTIDTAPSDPRRIYVSAYLYVPVDGGVRTDSVLLRSDDDGASWTTLPMGQLAADLEPYIAAIHPTDPQKIYVRLRSRDSSAGRVQNRLIYTDDGGAAWEQLFEGAADMLGFALSPDGSRVALGMGDSRSLGGTRQVDPAVLGVYTAAAADHAFTRRREGQVGCMNWTDRGLYFCGLGIAVDGGPEAFELGISSDEGVTATKLMMLAGVEGPLVCPADAQTKQVCDEQGDWPNVCVNIGRCDFETGEVVNAPRGDTCPQGTGGASGSGPGGSGGSGPGGSGPAGSGPGGGGSGGSAGSSSVPDGGAGGPGAETDDGGCGACGVSRREGSRDAALLGLLALGAFGALRQARRRRRPR